MINIAYFLVIRHLYFKKANKAFFLIISPAFFLMISPTIFFRFRMCLLPVDEYVVMKIGSS